MEDSGSGSVLPDSKSSTKTEASEEAKPEAAPLLTEITADVILGSVDGVLDQEKKQLVHQILAVMEKELYYWKTFPIVLPPTCFKTEKDDLWTNEEDRLQQLDVDTLRWYSPDSSIFDSSNLQVSLFQNLASMDELNELAYEDGVGGRMRKLSPEQLQQVWEKSAFIVPSKRFPGKNHVWQLSWLLVKGRENIRDTWRNDIAYMLWNLLQVPKRFWSNSLSISEGISHILRAIRNVFSLSIGIPEMLPQYQEDAIKIRLLRMRKDYAIEPFKATAESLREKKNTNAEVDPTEEILSAWVDVDTPTKTEGGGGEEKELERKSKGKGKELADSSEARKKKDGDEHDREGEEEVKLDLRIYDDGFMRYVEPILYDIIKKHQTAWYAERFAVARKLAAEITQELEKQRQEVEEENKEDNKNEEEETEKGKGKEKVDDISSSESTSEGDVDAEAGASATVADEDDEEREENEEKKQFRRELATLVKERCAEEQQRRLFDAILNDERLEKQSPGLGQAIVDYLRGLTIVRKVEMHRAQEIEKKKKEIRKKFQREHPYLSRVPDWLQGKVDRELAQWRALTKHDDWLEVIFKLEMAGLKSHAYLMKREFQWTQERRHAEKNRLKSLRVPATIHIWRRMIWRPSKWIIQKVNDSYYDETRYREVSVVTDRVGWRLLVIWTRSVTWLNNFLLYAFQNIWSGPLGIRALLLRSPFKPYKRVNSRTGQIEVDDSVVITTLCSRLYDLWVHIYSSRRQFEAQPDTGFIGKGITRIFNIVWNYVFKGLIGSLMVGVGMPVLVVLNVGVTLALILTCLLWVPATALLAVCSNLLLFDVDSTPNITSWSPLICTLYRLLVLRVGQAGVGLVGGLVVHPLVAGLIGLGASVRAGIRSFYDWVMYYLVVKPRGRIPTHDTFLARRVLGPGLSSGYYYQVRTADVLSALRLQLELDELGIYQNNMQKRINRPFNRYSAFIQQVLGPFLSSVSPRHDFLSAKAELYTLRLQKIIDLRRRRLPTISWEQRYKIRQNNRDLAATMHAAEEMVRDFVSTHIFEKLFGGKQKLVDQFWREKDLETNDWNGLARKMLASALSQEFLEPLRSSDTSIRLETVNAASVKEFVSMISKGAPRDDLDKVIVHMDMAQEADDQCLSQAYVVSEQDVRSHASPEWWSKLQTAFQPTCFAYRSLVQEPRIGFY